MATEIRMPRLGVNDDYVMLISWLVSNGDWVDKEQKIALIETSKEASEVLSEEAGIITLMVQENTDVAVGEVIASIGEGIRPQSILSNQTKELRMTEKARSLIEKNNIDVSLLPMDKLIREKDVLPFLNEQYMLGDTKYNEVILYGGGGFSEIVIDILKVSHAYHVYGIVDMKYPDLKEVMGVSVIGGDDCLGELYASGYRKIFNCIGIGVTTRKQPYEKLKKYGFEFPNIIHSRAILEPTVSLGEGNLICAGAIIGANVQIGNNCVINAGAIISHDNVISDNCHIASGAVLAGIVIVGENTLIGQNVTIYSRVRIGKNVIVENGCVIFKDVPDNTVVRFKR